MAIPNGAHGTCFPEMLEDTRDPFSADLQTLAQIRQLLAGPRLQFASNVTCKRLPQERVDGMVRIVAAGWKKGGSPLDGEALDAALPVKNRKMVTHLAPGEPGDATQLALVDARVTANFGKQHAPGRGFGSPDRNQAQHRNPSHKTRSRHAPFRGSFLSERAPASVMVRIRRQGPVFPQDASTLERHHELAPRALISAKESAVDEHVGVTTYDFPAKVQVGSGLEHAAGALVDATKKLLRIILPQGRVGIGVVVVDRARGNVEPRPNAKGGDLALAPQDLKVVSDGAPCQVGAPTQVAFVDSGRRQNFPKDAFARIRHHTVGLECGS